MTTASLLQVVISLIAGIGLIILLTTKYRVHAFFALLLACSVVGLGVQMPVGYIISVVKRWFWSHHALAGIDHRTGNHTGHIIRIYPEHPRNGNIYT
jgi:hypothetical protein